jgi:hypothetical protein
MAWSPTGGALAVLENYCPEVLPTSAMSAALTAPTPVSVTAQVVAALSPQAIAWTLDGSALAPSDDTSLVQSSLSSGQRTPLLTIPGTPEGTLGGFGWLPDGSGLLFACTRDGIGGFAQRSATLASLATLRSPKYALGMLHDIYTDSSYRLAPA